MAKRIAIMLASSALMAAVLVGGAAAQNDLGLALFTQQVPSVYGIPGLGFLFIINEDNQETEIQDISVNGRDECTEVLNLDGQISPADLHTAWLHQVLGQAGVVTTPNGKYLRFDGSRFDVNTQKIALKVGDELRWNTKCINVVRVTVVTDRGSNTFETNAGILTQELPDPTFTQPILIASRCRCCWSRNRWTSASALAWQNASIKPRRAPGAWPARAVACNTRRGSFSWMSTVRMWNIAGVGSLPRRCS